MSFFKAYDMRGTFGVDFTPEVVHQIGRALPRVVGDGKWLVGRDCRASSPEVHDALVKGLLEAGVEVVDLGLCTTPMVYFYTAKKGFDGSVMITASHNPPSDNGLKVSKKTALPVGYADGLDQVEEMVKRGVCCEGAKGKNAAVSFEGLARYIEWQKKNGPILDAGSGLKYAVDCSNGMSSLLVHELFPGAVVINDTLDGNFPCHAPNPLMAKAREQIAKVVREKGLDLGIIFDGDADRCMFVDERGDFVQPDYLIALVVKATMKRVGKGTGADEKVKVIHDVRTSRGAIEAMREMGCETVMVPVGHAFAKPILRECGALCGGELAGHYYFSEFFGCDSGVLAALRILSEVAAAKAEGKTFSELMAPISGRYANSGELNYRVEDKDATIRRVLKVAAEKLPREIGREEMDGIRIEYAEGWLNVRKSNTEPYLRLIVECAGAERLKEWVALLEGAIRES